MLLHKSETIIQEIKHILKKTISKLPTIVNETSNSLNDINVQVEKTKNLKFGDFSSNIMMVLGLSKDKVQLFAKIVADKLDKKFFKKVEVAGPGFLNLFLSDETINDYLQEISKEKDEYGKFKQKKLFYNIEFVSANPTGLLHIGHARNAAIGDTLANVWQTYGIDVNREYYVNDAGNQIEKLAMSVLIRYKQLLGMKDELPEDSYHGSEINDVAKAIVTDYKDKYKDVKCDQNKITDSNENVNFFKNFSKKFLLNIIKDTLTEFGVHMDIWFFESNIYVKGLDKSIIKVLANDIYQKDGATWLKTTKFNDDKDRVLIKSDGVYTYFLPDIAYHAIKLSRGYDKIYNIWGSDHASYADRMSIAIQMLGYKKEQLKVLIMQMVRLVKGGQEFKMSKRSGNSLTLQDLLQAIGKDTARWYLVSQSLDSHIEIDVNKATSNSNDNPIYYVQYAHARINQLQNNGKFTKPRNFDLLKTDIEHELMILLMYYKHAIESIAINNEVQKLPTYLLLLSKTFHSFYSNNKIIDNNNIELSSQRYHLSLCVKQILANGLKLMKIKPLDKMKKKGNI